MTPYAGMMMAHGLSVCTGVPWHSWTWCCGHGPTLRPHGKAVMRLAGNQVSVLYSTVQSCLYSPGFRKVEWLLDLSFCSCAGKLQSMLILSVNKKPSIRASRKPKNSFLANSLLERFRSWNPISLSNQPVLFYFYSFPFGEKSNFNHVAFSPKSPGIFHPALLMNEWIF